MIQQGLKRGKDNAKEKTEKGGRTLVIFVNHETAMDKTEQTKRQVKNK